MPQSGSHGKLLDPAWDEAERLAGLHGIDLLITAAVMIHLRGYDIAQGLGGVSRLATVACDRKCFLVMVMAMAMCR